MVTEPWVLMKTQNCEVIKAFAPFPVCKLYLRKAGFKANPVAGDAVVEGEDSAKHTVAIRL